MVELDLPCEESVIRQVLRAAASLASAGCVTDVFSRAGRSDHRARKGQTVTLDRETTVNARMKTGFCWKTMLSAIPAHS